MWIICDENDVIQDISSNEANLSRGYDFPNYKKYEIDSSLNPKVQDTYDGIDLTQNAEVRKARMVEGLRHQIIELEIRKDKAEALGTDYADIKTKLEQGITDLNDQIDESKAIEPIQ